MMKNESSGILLFLIGISYIIGETIDNLCFPRDSDTTRNKLKKHIAADKSYIASQNIRSGMFKNPNIEKGHYEISSQINAATKKNKVHHTITILINHISKASRASIFLLFVLSIWAVLNHSIVQSILFILLIPICFYIYYKLKAIHMKRTYSLACKTLNHPDSEGKLNEVRFNTKSTNLNSEFTISRIYWEGKLLHERLLTGSV